MCIEFKVCRNCKPPAWNVEFLPAQIVTELGKRAWKRLRDQMRLDGNLIHNTLPNRRLVLKIQKFFLNWQLHTIDNVMMCDRKTTVWHRDLVAAKCILYKGKSGYCDAISFRNNTQY